MPQTALALYITSGTGQLAFWDKLNRIRQKTQRRLTSKQELGILASEGYPDDDHRIVHAFCSKELMHLQTTMG